MKFDEKEVVVETNAISPARASIFMIGLRMVGNIIPFISEGS